MAPQNKKNVLVHHKDNGDVEVRRANSFSKPKAGEGKEKVLHFLGRERKYLCRCRAPEQHYERTYMVAKVSTHLNASILVFMDLHAVNSCAMADYRRWKARREDAWLKDGVDVNLFHYTNKKKDTVCRCRRVSKHGVGAPRNPEIIEQCAEYFCQHKNQMSCTSKEWKGVDPNTPPAYSPVSDPFDYDSASMVDLLHNRAEVQSPPTQQIRRPSQHSANRFTSALDYQDLILGGPSESDVPPRVWKEVQASRHASHSSAATLVSTPLGTTFAGSVAPDPYESRDSNSRIPPRGPGFQDRVQSAAHPESLAHPLIAELPAEPIRPKSHHTSTLRQLESDGEHQGASDRRLSQRVKRLPQRTSQTTYRLSTLFEEVHDLVRLPNQEEFLIQNKIAPPPQSKSASIDDCAVCQRPCHAHREQLILLPDCGHATHHDCLLKELRRLDQEIGKCPACEISFCERTLSDRIDTDRREIYGREFTSLRCDASIEFPQRAEAVTCMSEEELASTQLRLIKDYIDTHAEDLFRIWECNRAEPDWNNTVIRPCTKLFKAWDQPSRQCKFFKGRDLFVDILACAELVRLMNVTRTITVKRQGAGAPFPSLAQLHAKFVQAKGSYDAEKGSWRIDAAGRLICDMIVDDAVRLAYSTC